MAICYCYLSIEDLHRTLSAKSKLLVGCEWQRDAVEICPGDQSYVRSMMHAENLQGRIGKLKYARGSQQHEGESARLHLLSFLSFLLAV